MSLRFQYHNHPSVFYENRRPSHNTISRAPLSLRSQYHIYPILFSGIGLPSHKTLLISHESNFYWESTRGRSLSFKGRDPEQQSIK